MSDELQRHDMCFTTQPKNLAFIRADGTEVAARRIFPHRYNTTTTMIPPRHARCFMIEADPRREGRRRAKAVVPIQN